MFKLSSRKSLLTNDVSEIILASPILISILWDYNYKIDISANSLELQAVTCPISPVWIRFGNEPSREALLADGTNKIPSFSNFTAK